MIAGLAFSDVSLPQINDHAFVGLPAVSPGSGGSTPGPPRRSRPTTDLTAIKGKWSPLKII
jgi:hypothetical protein